MKIKIEATLKVEYLPNQHYFITRSAITETDKSTVSIEDAEQIARSLPIEAFYINPKATIIKVNSVELVKDFNTIESKVYPSSVNTISVLTDDTYGGAHNYRIIESLGFDSERQDHMYTNKFQEIKFIKKELDGSITPGLQSEQLLLVLIDRHRKLNERFPCDENLEMIKHLEAALGYQTARVRDRINRQVMGKLKK